MLKDILKEFDEMCILTKDGKCKYWKPEYFGYAKDDNEAPLDKFFPEEIKQFISDKLKQAMKEIGVSKEKIDKFFEV